MNGIFLLLGSNIGDRLGNLRRAANLLSDKGIHILDESSVYETEPWGKSNQPWFLNCVLSVETNLIPDILLSTCLNVESELGRVREEKWAERLIDIDILYYKNKSVSTEKLQIPHPEIPNRKFTLLPLIELAGLETHPILGKTQSVLLAECRDLLECKLTDFKI